MEGGIERLEGGGGGRGIKTENEMDRSLKVNERRTTLVAIGSLPQHRSKLEENEEEMEEKEERDRILRSK